MWADGDIVPRDKVEQWVRDAYPFPSFKASVREVDEPAKSRTRIYITITGPQGQPIVAKDRTAVYTSLRDKDVMPQPETDWSA